MDAHTQQLVKCYENDHCRCVFNNNISGIEKKNKAVHIQQRQDGMMMRTTMTIRPSQANNYSLCAERGRD